MRVYCVEVSWPLRLGFLYDDQVRKIFGRNWSGSGAGFGIRDHSGEYKNAAKAREVAAALRKVPNVKVTIDSWEER